jgi:hypothetical protein
MTPTTDAIRNHSHLGIVIGESILCFQFGKNTEYLLLRERERDKEYRKE